MCTRLHAQASPGYALGVEALEGSVADKQAARGLISLNLPGSVFFVYVIVLIQTGGKAYPSFCFLVLYVIAAFAQVVVLIATSDHIVGRLWRCGMDPDNAAIPYVTALGDLVGTVAL